MKALIHTLKIRYFLGFGKEELILFPSDDIFRGEDLLKIFAHGFVVGKTNDVANSNLIFYN